MINKSGTGKSGGFPKTCPVPHNEFRNQEEIESTDSAKSISTETGLKLRRGPFGFLRGGKIWAGIKLRFRIRPRRGR